LIASVHERWAWSSEWTVRGPVSGPGGGTRGRPVLRRQGAVLDWVHGRRSIDPEQGYVGVFYQTPDIGGRFRLRTGLDGGFGQDLRLGTVNIDFVYLLPLGNGPWKFLTGGGPTIVLLTYADESYDSGTEVTAGGSWLLGFAHDNGFFTEFRIGGGNVQP